MCVCVCVCVLNDVADGWCDKCNGGGGGGGPQGLAMVEEVITLQACQIMKHSIQRDR